MLAVTSRDSNGLLEHPAFFLLRRLPVPIANSSGHFCPRRRADVSDYKIPPQSR